MQIAKILTEALEKNASDIILTALSFPSIKVNGEIIFLENYPKNDPDELNIEILKLLNEKQTLKFKKEKEIDFSINLKDQSRFRVNCFIQKRNYGIVFRPVKKEIPNFNLLGIPNKLIDFTHKKNGLVLVTGGVGSGKSTTLAAIINYINKNQKKHIITIEDPIEYIFESEKSLIEQREIGIDTLDYENGLKYSLRQAGDVIMVGELRDLETIRLALRAAETGNLVLATLHTAGCARTIARIIDIFPSGEKEQIKQQLSESLIGIIWQDLIKKVDSNGRVPAVELLVNTTSISNMIRKGTFHQIDGVIETSAKEGMIPMSKSLENLFINGKIDKEILDFNIKNIKVL